MLILAYPTGLQIWDCTNLSAISEVLNLNLNSDEWGMLLGSPDLSRSTASVRGGGGNPGMDEEGSSQALRIVHAALLPPPSRRSLGHAGRDAFGEDRPLLGILMDSSDEDERELEPRSTFVLYSLRRHQLVKRLTLPGLASSFTPNEHFIIISTTAPPTLHVLSSSTFHTLHTIASGSLEPFATPLFTGSSTALNLTNLNLASAQSTALSISNAITSTAQSTLSNKPKSVLLAGPGLSIDEDTAIMNTNTNAQRQPTWANEFHPVYALSHRLLAYASPSPAASPSLQATLGKASRRLSSSSTATSASASNAASSVSSSPFGGLESARACLEG
ncbi:hypothetical protein NLJ89_g11658 [Agrocybe chaxingu]|uniref:Uncharacterized protein n=1 Tax=Agrocybe chaxingu TaxID=84603 RepID=A0A9W8JNB4_9AGAR|nr:hypothetical protein NLJ89_g11658 [Agrocybe chaxingu]